MRKKCYQHIILAACLLASCLSCKKLVEVNPPVTNPTDATVYQSNATAAAVLTGIYIRMIENGGGLTSGSKSISLLCGLSADELRNYAADPFYAQFYTNSVSQLNAPFWQECYQHIYTANAALEGLSKSTGVTDEFRRQLMGEAYFLRGFFYFYLVNLFGDVPLHTVTDYKITSVATRTPAAQVFQQIVADLKQAEDLLSEEYKNADNTNAEGRFRPNKFTAAALLARVYLYLKDYSNAETKSAELLDNPALYALDDNLGNIFLGASKEAIWQLQPVAPQVNTWDGIFFIINATPGLVQPAAMSSDLLQAFEEGDKRRDGWVGSYEENGTAYYFPYKYKIGDYGQPLSEYLMVMRVAEQFLIRAEARAQQGNLAGAGDDLNHIRQRAGLAPVEPSDKPAMLAAIEQERRVELFTEWGHRWLDLKRTGRVDAVMTIATAQKGGTWNANWQWYPIPISEIQNNPRINQNQGY